MKNKTLKNGTLMAASLATVFGCATSKPAAEPSGATVASIRCQGLNSCQGHGECASTDHKCGKYTPCKSQGWISVASAEECQAKGGNVL